MTKAQNQLIITALLILFLLLLFFYSLLSDKLNSHLAFEQCIQMHWECIVGATELSDLLTVDYEGKIQLK